MTINLVGMMAAALSGYCLGYTFMTLKRMEEDLRAFRKQLDKDLAKLERHDKHLG